MKLIDRQSNMAWLLALILGLRAVWHISIAILMMLTKAIVNSIAYLASLVRSK